MDGAFQFHEGDWPSPTAVRARSSKPTNPRDTCGQPSDDTQTRDSHMEGARSEVGGGYIARMRVVTTFIRDQPGEGEVAVHRSRARAEPEGRACGH